MSEISEPHKFRTLFISNINYESTDESLKSYFEQWGGTVQCTIKRDPNTGRSKGFGFVTYKRASMVDDAQAARPHKIDGRVVNTKRAFPRELSRKQPGILATVNTIYINGLTEDFREQDLCEYFGPYGNIVSVRIVKDKDTGENKGFAFVKFDDYDPVDKIMLRSHAIKDRKIDVRKAVSREKKNIEMKKDEEDLSKDQETLRAAEVFHIDGYSGEYEQGYGEGNWQDCYGNSYVIGPDGYLQDCYGNSYLIATEGFENLGYSNIYQNETGDGAWGANYISCYDGTPVQGNTDYAERNHGYDNDDGQGVYGQP